MGLEGWVGVEWCEVDGDGCSQHFFELFHPQPLLQEGVVVGGGCWGTQQLFSECHSQDDGQDDPFGGLGGFLAPPYGRQHSLSSQLRDSRQCCSDAIARGSSLEFAALAA